MCKAVLLCDGNNILAANTHANLSLTTKKGTPTGGVFGSIRSIRTMLLDALTDYEFSSIWWVKDAGRPAYRTTLCPTYKNNRNKNDDNPRNRVKGRGGNVVEFREAYKSQKVLIEKFLPLINIGIAWTDGWEADDTIGVLATQIYTDRPVVIVSGDKDMLQLAERDRVAVYMPHSQRLVTKVPSNYLLRRCLEGDSSDNIPGVTGLGGQRALEILEECKATSPKRLIAEYRGKWYAPVKTKGDKPSTHMRLSEDRAKERLRNNWKVMSLARSARLITQEVSVNLMPMTPGIWKPKTFLKRCRKYQFDSITGDDTFLNPFKGITDV